MAVTSLPHQRPIDGAIRTPTKLPWSHASRGHEVRQTARRHGLLSTADIYFRRQDTRLARGLARLAPTHDAGYVTSRTKRALDVLVGVPLAAVALVLIALLMVVNRLLAPQRPALFQQDRVGHGGSPLRVVKIRSMIREPRAGTTVCTTFGRFIRRYYLDELPQLFQVLFGQVTLVGIRILPRDVYESLALSWSRERFETWQSMYATAPLGLTGAHQVFRGTEKHDQRRFHHDMFYASHATLGFDLYLLWRTLGSRDGKRPTRKESNSHAC